MSSVAWFDLNVDGLGVLDPTGHVATRDRSLAVFDDAPDVVRLPATLPEHGGRVLRVLSSFTAACPICRCDVVHWKLEDRFALACCKATCGFVTYRRRAIGGHPEG